MEQQHIESKLDSSWIVHDDSLCGKHWNPAILGYTEVQAIFDHTIHYGVYNHPTTEPRKLDIEKPMSMFSRAYQGEISDITKKILAKN